MEKEPQKIDYMAKIEDIRYRMNHGVITYDQAKIEAKPIIAEMNERAEKIAKQFGRRHNKFTFAYLMR